MALRELAGNLKIGAAVNNFALIKQSQYQNVLAAQFNLLVPENGMKCHVVCQNPNTYSGSRCYEVQ
ncbi:endo-1,4-beta-xylanase [Microseira sp. BLCC-F43]|jgi:GH35 family endo-1,4-beta-xylanase|uniref:endo-1,4-beta-xylanase n=1 Tax=Microseira sp. BLCC-F43 TaxID=3153602 RepID=UPI0035BA6AC2